MLVTHLSAVAPSVVLLMMVVLLAMMLLVVLVLIFMVHIHLHITLMCSSIYYHVLSLLVILTVQPIIVGGCLGYRGSRGRRGLVGVSSSPSIDRRAITRKLAVVVILVLLWVVVGSSSRLLVAERSVRHLIPQID